MTLKCSAAEPTDLGSNRVGNVRIGTQIPAFIDLGGRTTPALEVSKPDIVQAGVFHLSRLDRFGHVGIVSKIPDLVKSLLATVTCSSSLSSSVGTTTTVEFSNSALVRPIAFRSESNGGTYM